MFRLGAKRRDTLVRMGLYVTVPHECSLRHGIAILAVWVVQPEVYLSVLFLVEICCARRDVGKYPADKDVLLSLI